DASGLTHQYYFPNSKTVTSTLFRTWSDSRPPLVVSALLRVASLPSRPPLTPSSFLPSSACARRFAYSLSCEFNCSSIRVLVVLTLPLFEQINQQEVARYIQTLENGDYGYGKSAGLPSDL